MYEVAQFILYKLWLKSIVGIDQCSHDECNKLKCCKKKQSNEDLLPFYKLQNITEWLELVS